MTMPMEDLALGPRPGQMIAGKYRVERVLGRGGMGFVVACMHVAMERRVALKLLLPEVTRNPELVARFAREARAAGIIQSEHVAKVLDVGTLEDGAPFMVMEYLEGKDLADVVRSRGALPGQEAIEYVLQAGEALAEAHAAGIVHRDLKPANLFLTSRPDGSPSVKVLDFGISKVNRAGEAGMTQTQSVMGSPNYMAPEQLKSARTVDARADIWALGIILQELLTGDVAFKADTVPELYVAILQDHPIPLRAKRPDAPAAIEAIVYRCLEKDPARRFQTVAELATALGEFAPPRARLHIERIQRILGAPNGGQGAAPQAAPAHASAHAPAPAVAPPSVAAPFSGHPPQTHPQAPYQAGPYTHPPAGAYGPSVPNYSQAYQAPYGQPPMGTMPVAAPADKPRMSTASIVLLTIVGLMAVGGGGCMLCVCAAAGSAQQQQHPGTTQPGRH